MSTISILHIFNDEKFIDRHISNIRNGNFQNTFIYLRNTFNYTGEFPQLLKYIKPYSKEFYDLIRDCPRHHILILYYLSADKAYIVNRLGKNRPVIVWSFYGADLYGFPEIKRDLLTKETLRILSAQKEERLLFYVKNILRPLYKILDKGAESTSTIRKAISRIDYFAWFDNEEYNLLNQKLKNKLPAFLETPITTPFRLIHPNRDKLNSVLLGNSASPYNNHIDIIHLFQKCRYHGSIYIPISYGKQQAYKEKIEEYCRGTELNVIFLKGYVEYGDYVNLINQQNAVVFNSYRQMALGNIFIALKCGAKVYLSLKNPSYQWLKKFGFFIYSVEENLECDIRENKLRLPQEWAESNAITCDKIGDETAGTRFLCQLKEIGETGIHSRL